MEVIRLLSSHNLGGVMITCKRDSFQVLEKDTPVLQEVHIHLKGTEKRFTIVRGFLFVCFKNKWEWEVRDVD